MRSRSNGVDPRRSLPPSGLKLPHRRDARSLQLPRDAGAITGILAAGALGAILVIVATSKYGVAAISDSAAYISTARNVAAGRGFLEWNGEPYVMWPPQYPMLLALFEIVGVDALVAARWVNAGLHAAVACIAGFSLRGMTGEVAIPVLVAGGIALAPALLDEAIVVMSEPLFAFLVLSCLVVLARHLVRPRGHTLLAVAILAALAWLTRYAGFALVATGGLLLLARRGRRPAIALAEATAFGAIASIPMVAWLIRNYLATRTTTGVRHESPYPFAYFAELALQRIGQWFLPPRAGPSATVVLGAVVIGVAAAVLVGSIVSTFRDDSTRPRWWYTSTESATVVFATFTLVYIVSITLLISLTFAADDPKRLLAPAVPSSLMLLGLLFARTRLPRWRAAVVAVVTAFLLVWPARYAIGLVHYTRRNGAGGVASDRWQQSGVIAHLRQHAASLRRDGALIFSNEPTAVYLLTDLQSVVWLPPHDNPYSPVSPKEALASFVRDLPRHDPTYVALFDQVLESFAYSRALVETTVPVTLVHSASDGALYRITFGSVNPARAPR